MVRGWPMGVAWMWSLLAHGGISPGSSDALSQTIVASYHRRGLSGLWEDSYMKVQKVNNYRYIW